MTPSHQTASPDGITCVICCHNSSARLPATLAALARQEVPTHIRWEVLVINNASTDETAAVARQSWSADPSRLRVVEEPTAGLSNARIRALAEAHFAIISFIDDDNHVAADWVALAHQTMHRSPEIGLVGGKNLPRPEIPPPHWFEPVRGFWAVEGTPRPGGDITNTECFPSGAGLTLRKSAFQDLVDAGFQFTLTGRQGKGMGAGEDHELVMGLLLRGWKAWHEPKMVLEHFLPAERLTWHYATRLLRGVGEAGALMDAYLYLWMDRHGPRVGPVKSHWAWRAAAAFRDWLALLAMSLKDGGIKEGNPRLLLAERAKGRFTTLLRIRGDYGRRRRDVAKAPWLQLPEKEAD